MDTNYRAIIMREVALQLAKAFKSKARIQQHSNNKDRDPVIYLYSTRPGMNQRVPRAGVFFRAISIDVMYNGSTVTGKLSGQLEWTGNWHEGKDIDYANPNAFDLVQSIVESRL